LTGARTLAQRVRKLCESIVGNPGYWREATLGEAALILGDFAAATTHYANAAALGRHRFGDLASTRRQSRILLAHLRDAPADVAKALAIPPIVAFAGHMIDANGRASPRFPASLESPVRKELRSRLVAIAPAAVYASAACGGDLLCLEIARGLGAETHIVLPFPAAEFRRVSVDFAGPSWSERFDRELAAASSVTVTSDHHASGSAATFEYANLILTGAARLRAQQLDTSLKALAVCDLDAGARRGGTAWTLAQWRRAGIGCDRIALEDIRGARDAKEPAAEGTENPGKVRHELRAMLFADAVGYSKLGEDQIPSYIEGFLGAVGELSRRSKHRYEHVEVAGDGLYMVFGTVEDAGRFALELSALANGFDRAAWSLPPNFNLRIALHCGPVHCARDPITGGPLYTGPHTSRTARIEPITPPGQVYASSAFATVAAATGIDFALSYVGRMPLAKGYGSLGLYHLRSA
jgi:class 3 adenylate cyclase